MKNFERIIKENGVVKVGERNGYFVLRFKNRIFTALDAQELWDYILWIDYGIQIYNTVPISVVEDKNRNMIVQLRLIGNFAVEIVVVDNNFFTIDKGIVENFKELNEILQKERLDMNLTIEKFCSIYDNKPDDILEILDDYIIGTIKFSDITKNSF